MSAIGMTAETWEEAQRKLQATEQWKCSTKTMEIVERVAEKWSAGVLTPMEALIHLATLSVLTIDPELKAWLMESYPISIPATPTAE